MRGDVHQLKAPRGAKGHQQRGNRYAVVVQSDLLPLTTWLGAPTSTSARPASFRPAIEIDGTPTLVLVEQVAAVDPERLGSLVGHVSQSELADINQALRIVLECTDLAHIDTWLRRAATATTAADVVRS